MKAKAKIEPDGHAAAPFGMSTWFWGWPSIAGFLGLVASKNFHLLHLDSHTFSICWVAFLVAPMLWALASSSWFRGKAIAFAVVWFVQVFALVTMTAGVLNWFFMHTYYDIMDPQHTEKHPGYE
ncbi:MAG: hypothetical protein JSS83_14575 [Cyanobacteria bacterium SZAS LIN-3]|nr:hypothetical protein [Cyanobacteria bacterium SZAS LIN-3]